MRATVAVSFLVAAPVWAAVEVTNVTFTGQLDPALAGVSAITVDGASIPVTENRTFEANIPVPFGATSISFVMEVVADGENQTRTIELELEHLGPPIEGLDVSAAELETFLGGRGGKLVWVDAGQRLRWLDFTGATAAVEVMEDTHSVINPLISPDGTRVVYSSGFATGSKSIFVRDLAAHSTPVWIGYGDIGFWSGSGGDQIVYSDWSAKNENGAGGKTHVQELSGTTPVGKATVVHHRAMDGGVNREMTWLGQVYGQVYAYDVPGAVEYSFEEFFLFDGTVADHQTCSGSMAPDASAHLMLLVIPHDWVRIFSFIRSSSRFEETSRFELPERMSEWEFPEWSTHIGYFSVVLRQGGTHLRLYLAKIATGDLVPELLAVTPWSTTVTYSHLWVEP